MVGVALNVRGCKKMDAQRIFGKIPTWKALRTLGASRLVGLSVLVPIIGYFIVFSKLVDEYLTLDPEIFKKDRSSNIEMINYIINLPRPEVLYFGLVFVGIGSVFYNIFCPDVIKENESATSYFNDDVTASSYFQISYFSQQICRFKLINTSYYQGWIHQIQETYGEVFKDTSTKGVERALSKKAQESRSVLSPSDFYEQVLKPAAAAVVVLYYSINNWSKPVPRAVCFCFYLIGFFLVGLASLQAFIEITLSLWD